MAPQGNYFPDHERRILWILIPKCATTTLDVVLETDGKRVHRSEAEQYADYYTIAFVRHPWRRILSALHTVLDTHEPFPERVRRHILEPWPDVNMHVRPMHTFTDGFRLDFVGCVDRMESHWRQLGKSFNGIPPLKHENQHAYPLTLLSDFDWSILGDRYEGDWGLFLGQNASPTLESFA